MEHQKLNKIIGFAVFVISLIVYGKTVAPTTSYWDCGEFITSSYILGVPHPPGAPLHVLVGRVFTMIPDWLISDMSSTFGLEVRGSSGLADDDIQGYEFSIDKMISVFGRLSLQNDTNITPYILGGYTKVWVDTDLGSGTDSDLSYGVGAALGLTDDLSVAVEYVVYIDKNSYDFSGPGITLAYKF